jgi:hypothetical protein
MILLLNNPKASGNSVCIARSVAQEEGGVTAFCSVRIATLHKGGYRRTKQQYSGFDYLRPCAPNTGARSVRIDLNQCDALSIANFRFALQSSGIGVSIHSAPMK